MSSRTNTAYDKISKDKQKEGTGLMDIYDKIKALREDHDMTQEQLAKITNVTTRHIRRWEAKESEMGITKLLAICQYFNVSADYILGLPRGLSWPREETARKEGQARKIYNSTKYSFLLRSRAHSDLRTMCVDLMRPLSLQTTSDGGLPKIVIETRIGAPATPELL